MNDEMKTLKQIPIPKEEVSHYLLEAMMKLVPYANIYRRVSADMQCVSKTNELLMDCLGEEEADDSNTIYMIEDYFKKLGENAVPIVVDFDDTSRSVQTLEMIKRNVSGLMLNVDELSDDKLDEYVKTHLKFYLLYNHIAELMIDGIKEKPKMFVDSCKNNSSEMSSDYTDPEKFASMLGEIYDTTKERAVIIYNDWVLRKEGMESNKNSDVDAVLRIISKIN